MCAVAQLGTNILYDLSTVPVFAPTLINKLVSGKSGTGNFSLYARKEDFRYLKLHPYRNSESHLLIHTISYYKMMFL